MQHRVWVEINLKALVRNYRKIAAKVKPAQVLCVLKANAYGLGVAEYARALAGAGCTAFGVAEPYEAKELIKELGMRNEELGMKDCKVKVKGQDQERRDSCPFLNLTYSLDLLPSTIHNSSFVIRNSPTVQILSSVLPDEIPEMVRAGVILPIIDLPTARLISAAAVKAKVVAKVHFKLDTGMGRLGILAKDAPAVIREVVKLPNLDCEGIFSHFPMAYDPEDPFTKTQIRRFKDVLAAVNKYGITFKKVHIAASDAINNFPETAKPPFTQVRTGINLHGSFDPNGRRALKVEPVLTLKTRVAQVRELPAGTTLGYGRTWCLAALTRIATISAGYADGLPLALTNRGHVLIRGKVCPVIGRISMDYTTVDVSDVKGVRPGDEVICFGAAGGHVITPDDWAALKGTHAYDIICSLGTRVERRYVK